MARNPNHDERARFAESDHQRLLNETRRKITEVLDRSVLSAENRREFGKAIHEVLDKLTPTALARHARNTRAYRFYDSKIEMISSFFKKYPEARPIVFSGVFDPDGVLHLDGTARVEGRVLPLQEVYAHEITHTIDGNGHEISDSKAWRSAWQSEVGFFIGKAKASASEGFAHFGQMLLGDEQIGREGLREHMLGCLKVWEGAKL